ncbi:MAG TPA: hypothetical protein VNM91_12570 [Dehalococcoidia bacterium]|nr:hypothetical protein [Dehalococcoidia bacterium]
MSNIETARAIYAAFGAGDVPAILEHLADDVAREYGQGETDVPWLQPRQGALPPAASSRRWARWRPTRSTPPSCSSATTPSSR